MKIQRSSEDYLETMLMLRERNGFVRAVDIATHLGVTKPSVSYATKRLRESGYIETDADGFIVLLPSGLEIAQKIYTRHKLLSEFLISLGVDETIAREDACKIEHDISPETFEAICRHAAKFK